MELPTDDQPATEIWLDDEAITAHFDWVRDKYRSQADGDTVANPAQWSTNELTQQMKN